MQVRRVSGEGLDQCQGESKGGIGGGGREKEGECVCVRERGREGGRVCVCVRGREYQDNWCKYAESLEKDSTNVKVREEGRDRRRGRERESV